MYNEETLHFSEILPWRVYGMTENNDASDTETAGKVYLLWRDWASPCERTSCSNGKHDRMTEGGKNNVEAII